MAYRAAQYARAALKSRFSLRQASDGVLALCLLDPVNRFGGPTWLTTFHLSFPMMDASLCRAVLFSHHSCLLLVSLQGASCIHLA